MKIKKGDSIKEKEMFLEIRNIQHEKGNFKFYCFKFSTEERLDNIKIKEFESIINNHNQDIYVDLYFLIIQMIFMKIEFLIDFWKIIQKKQKEIFNWKRFS